MSRGMKIIVKYWPALTSPKRYTTLGFNKLWVCYLVKLNHYSYFCPYRTRDFVLCTKFSRMHV